MTDKARPRFARCSAAALIVYCALLQVLLAPAAAFAQETSLNQELEPVRIKYGLPALAAAAVKDGAIVASGVTGERVHGSGIAVTVGDRFHLGSDTKAMTATLAAMLVEEGKLKWTSAIGEVLGADVPGIDPKLAAVTLEQLLSHTSGIPSDTEEMAALYFSTGAFEYNLPALRLRILAAWKDHAPGTEPGSAFHYANLGYVIAGAMIEKAAGMPWEELITSRIFVPLGLASAGLGPQASRGRLDAPVGHRIDPSGKVVPMPWGDAADVPAVLGPAGVAHMSVLDFAKWAGWNAGEGKRGPALIGPETLKSLHRPRISTGPLPNARPGTPQEGEYALGWGVVKFAWAPQPALTHSGSNGMNLAMVLVDPGQDFAAVVLTNFPEERADKALIEVMEMLYRRFSKEK